MKKLKHLLGFTLVTGLSVFTISNVKAAVVPCDNITTEESLRTALNARCDIITLGDDIELKSPIEFDNIVTIDGKGESKNYTISASADFEASGSNGTLITAKPVKANIPAKANITLKNLILSGAPKYGVQAFDGGEVTLDIVEIKDCLYGGVLVNGGIVTIKDLLLRHNGAKGENNGIEISKGKSVTGDNNPKLIMDGILESTETDGVVNVATNDDNLKDFIIQNTRDTENKIYIEHDGIVVTNEAGTIVYEGNGKLKDGIQGKQLTYRGKEAVTHKVTISYSEKSISFVVNDEETLASAADTINGIKKSVEDKKFVKFVTSDGKAYDEEVKITSDISLIALFEDVNVQNTPDSEEESKEQTEENPNTLDSLPLYLVGGAVAVLGVAGLGYSIKKKFEN